MKRGGVMEGIVSEPLTAEEIEVIRSDLAKYPDRYDKLQVHEPLVYARRLLATLDAARDRQGLDVMTLRRALERGLAAVDDEWTIEELAEIAAREYATQSTEPES